MGNSETKVPSEKAVAQAMSAAGYGDMLKANYATKSDSIVDKSYADENGNNIASTYISKFKLLNNGVKFFEIDSNCYSLLSLVRNSCESINNIEKYLGKNKFGYFWSFNNFTKFNNPINLSDFYIIKNTKYIPVNVPPQSFIYAYIDEEKNYL